MALEWIRRIRTELANPEIILTFNVDWLIDFLSEQDDFLKAMVPVELTAERVREMLELKGQREARWLIQHFLYRHVVERTGAPYYTCFYIMSPESHRSYWLLHISGHPKARDEMTLRHWAYSTHSLHHGQPGLNMLGFVPERDLDQIPIDFGFDANAATRARNALLRELPPLIFDVGQRMGAVTLGTLYTGLCNDTPATLGHFSEVLVDLREQGEIEVLSKEGRTKPRTKALAWDDVIRPAAQRSLFSSVWPVRS